jgi:hypothetical protein
MLNAPKGTLDPPPDPSVAQTRVRTLSPAILCPGCQQPFTPRRPTQRHCRPACRKRAERNRLAARLEALAARLDGGDAVQARRARAAAEEDPEGDQLAGLFE